ncbi:MAG: zf-HC2 domain-containing protein [Thermoleophilaceae bacterium]
MEQATLRPVPLRPAGPVDPAEAVSHVGSALPDLDAAAARALALIEIAGRTREQAGDETGLTAEVLADALYRARKALRRSMFPLSASGWCERAERLLSDRIDGVLGPPGPARLDVHLRNCERCVDHDRRLAHARDKLVREFIDTHPESAAGPAERTRVAELRVVETIAVEESAVEQWAGPTRIVPGFGGPAVVPASDDEPAPPHPSFAGPGGQTDHLVDQRAAGVAEPETPAPPEPEPPEPEDPPAEQTIAPAEPADATPSEHDAETADPLVPADEEAAPTTHPDQGTAAAPSPAARPLLGSILWTALLGISVALAVLAAVVTILAIVGVDHIL